MSIQVVSKLMSTNQRQALDYLNSLPPDLGKNLYLNLEARAKTREQKHTVKILQHNYAPAVVADFFQTNFHKPLERSSLFERFQGLKKADQKRVIQQLMSYQNTFPNFSSIKRVALQILKEISLQPRALDL